jgi:hypothetical protein
MKYIYIVLTQTGTFFSRGIKFFTKEEFNHSSISFSENLDKLYSFGRKVVNNPLIGGFVTEKLNQGVFGKFPETSCAVIRVPVKDVQYEILHKKIKEFLKNKETYKYNFIGLLTIKLPFNINRKNSYFCSQFVSYILNSANIKTKHISELSHPMDFLELEGAEVIYKGLLRKYSSSTGTIEKVLLQA